VLCHNTPVVHVDPVYPAVQEQVNEAMPSKQVPPFWHKFGTQSLMSEQKTESVRCKGKISRQQRIAILKSKDTKFYCTRNTLQTSGAISARPMILTGTRVISNANLRA
jgi:hypothetical protein